ncbi:MAG TPA: CRISPR-associated protein Cas4 [Leptospiraceae bacterium]|nr:CRISPR-associated protein Cas4 [Leptospiraceae bacterium]HMW08615.1 CRISPR-associated protein Cas4 [Leptospiraceae bacterium]HMX34571.1 CRISPR-associated protein Cas4 [Leptospiraceae bacterium]HMY34365.1 CRISPR-associated protein Cas4 [Leptospiraceae bacterium]HMZ66675.1 CRISPR-associated protein Cas4 [Leptospiraceae bacterium]
MYEDSLTIVQLRQYFFCPRINWFQVNSYNLPKENIWMSQGNEYHVHRENLLKKKLLKRFQNKNCKLEYRIPVYSSKYKIHGIVDAIVRADNDAYPVEFKLNPASKSKGIFFQMLGYAVCLEEKYNLKIEKGFLVAGKNPKVVEIKFSDEDKKELAQIVEKIKEIRESDFLPESSASKEKCIQCEYLNFCNDRNL